MSAKWFQHASVLGDDVQPRHVAVRGGPKATIKMNWMITEMTRTDGRGHNEGDPLWSPTGWRIEVSTTSIAVGGTTIPIVVMRAWWADVTEATTVTVNGKPVALRDIPWAL